MLISWLWMMRFALHRLLHGLYSLWSLKISNSQKSKKKLHSFVTLAASSRAYGQVAICRFSQTVLIEVLGLGSTVLYTRTFQLTRSSSHQQKSFAKKNHIHRVAMIPRTRTRKTKQERWNTCVIYVNLRSVNVLGMI